MSLKQRLQKTLIELMAINEIYPNEKEVIRYVEHRLDEAGVKWQEDGFRNVIATIPGQGESVMYSTHLDIPEPAPNVKYTIEGDVIRSDGSSILGVDPKTGLAILIELLIDLAAKDHATHAPLEVLLTRGEETGLFGARNADYSLLKSKIGLVLDEDGPVTQVVIQAPGYVRFDAEFIGKIVHPREPENGINALQMACEALSSIPWGYSAAGVTWNVGLLSAGTARNSVPGKVSLKAELRSYDNTLVEAEGKRIEKIFCDVAKKFHGQCIVEHEFEFEGYQLDQTHPLFQRLESTFGTMELKPNYFATFGGSDANVFNARGIICVPIGSGYYNAHQYTEYADIGAMEQIFDFLNRFLQS
ncbi:MAG: M20/M25/M40 family metallo-hydrolase [Candidatus Uhrbacteria bacterium]|nr:M20/M25/M40 family metallo-hydrolase [Candidatus Uhrbacteria bacterium]